MSLKIPSFDFAGISPVLATRSAGRDAGVAAAAQLADGGALVLNFNGVEVASPSFLAEVVNALHGPLANGAGHLLVTGMNEDVSDALDLVLGRAKMILGELRDDQIELIGGNEQLRATLAEAMALETFTAPELAEKLKVKLPALHQRLNQLMSAGLLKVEDDPTAKRGKRGKYTAPPATKHAAEVPNTDVAQELVLPNT